MTASRMKRRKGEKEKELPTSEGSDRDSLPILDRNTAFMKREDLIIKGEKPHQPEPNRALTSGLLPRKREEGKGPIQTKEDKKSTEREKGEGRSIYPMSVKRGLADRTRKKQRGEVRVQTEKKRRLSSYYQIS